jgi:hypothetical protein
LQGGPYGSADAPGIGPRKQINRFDNASTDVSKFGDKLSPQFPLGSACRPTLCPTHPETLIPVNEFDAVMR